MSEENLNNAATPRSVDQQQACSDVVVRETFAGEMMKRGLATGHGDTLAEMHAQLWWQFDEIRNRQNNQSLATAGAGLPKP